jgi:hypothetical protein
MVRMGLLSFASARACGQDMINMLSAERLFDRLLLCAADEFFIDSQACINQLPDVIYSDLGSLTPDCMKCVTDFISSIHGLEVNVKELCSRNPRSESCIGSEAVRDTLISFQSCAKYSLTYPSCSTQEVRSFLEADVPSEIFRSVVNSDVMLGDAVIPRSLCGVCYQNMLNSLRVESQSNNTLAAGIRLCNNTSVSTALCQQRLGDYFDSFSRCAGRSIARYGPDCTEGERRQLTDLDPYGKLTNCAFHPEATSCDNIYGFLYSIESRTSKPCAACYREYFDRVSSIRATFSAGSTCANIRSPTCLSWNAPEILNLYRCSVGT